MTDSSPLDDDALWTRRRVSVGAHEVMTFSAGDGPHVLLMLHGGPGCPSRYLRESHAWLTTTGWRLVTWDQLGCGESDQPSDSGLWSLERFVTEVECVRKALLLERFHLLGQSWGGVLGLEYLLEFPSRVASFIAADTAFDLPAMQRGFDRKKLALGAETCRMMARHEAQGSTQHPEYQAAVTLLMYRHVCRMAVWPESLTWCLGNLGAAVFSTLFGPYFFQCSGTLRHWDRMDALEKLAVPVLLVHGEHDYIEVDLASRARDRISDAELLFLEGCSHTPFFEQPEAYRVGVRRFLEKQMAPSAGGGQTYQKP